MTLQSFFLEGINIYFLTKQNLVNYNIIYNLTSLWKVPSMTFLKPNFTIIYISYFSLIQSSKEYHILLIEKKIQEITVEVFNVHLRYIFDMYK